MIRELDRKFEECPLQQHPYCQKKPKILKGPLRVVRLCMFGILLPAVFIALPLYLRYHVYANQFYPFAVSDMRLLDKRISTIWCQKQLVKVNATFNAFLMSQTPQVAPNQKVLSMVRELVLEDDMKEYWGFYLLAGSAVTVSTCVRWPGASLIVLRGHKHLHECAYIGDDSSEELDELLEVLGEGLNRNINNESSEPSAAANIPQIMRRHNPDVRFHDPLQNKSLNFQTLRKEVEDVELQDPKLLKSLLEALSKKANKKDPYRQKLIDMYNMEIKNAPISNPTTTKPVTNKYSTSTSETPTTKIETVINDTSSEELFRELSRKLDALGSSRRQNRILEKLSSRAGTNLSDSENVIDGSKKITERKRRDLTIATALRDHFNEDDEERDAAIEEEFTSDGIADHRGSLNETTLNDRSNSEFWSSFSSSEEALLNCNGLILNLPLSPHTKCHKDQPEHALKDASLTNTITYVVPNNGYYFFIFNSENEVQANYIRVGFHLNKTMYDVSQPVSSCSNKSESCALELGFFSHEKMVLEVPVIANESRWNEEFIVVSECEPRTVIYMCCVLSVPVLIIVFAFQ